MGFEEDGHTHTQQHEIYYDDYDGQKISVINNRTKRDTKIIKI